MGVFALHDTMNLMEESTYALLRKDLSIERFSFFFFLPILSNSCKVNKCSLLKKKKNVFFYF